MANSKNAYKRKAITAGAVILVGMASMLIVASFGRLAKGQEAIESADAFLAEQPEWHPHTTPIIPSHDKFEPADRPYTWEMEMCAKVVGFEVGLSCDICKFYVASACINRMHYWYNDRPIAMITDYSDETGYYMMYPPYAYEDEFYGFSYSEHREELLPYVWAAEKAPADIWYWDCDDTQGEWAELVWYCPEDDMYYYK